MANEIVQTNTNYPQTLTRFEESIISFLGERNLPNEKIFSDVNERITIFQNVDHVLSKVEPELCQKSVYLSKFLAAGAAGLFDASLNYLWDETIMQLRARIAQFDLEYFYDNAVGGDKRRQFSTVEDLMKLQDSELIKGARNIELISDVGYQHLAYINYMRNWASAAHPNQTEISGLQLLSWLETCIKEVISLPIPGGVARIKKLLGNIRTTTISQEDAKETGLTFAELTQEQANSLSLALFGIYTKTDTDEPTRQNVRNLLPYLWGYVDEETKSSFGIKYGYFTANGENNSKQFAKEFLEMVDGSVYIPDNLRIVDIEKAITNLLNAHRGYNNFYNEEPWAKHLRTMVGNPVKVPSGINKKYVLAIVEVYITNGCGVCWDAEPIYVDLINNFTSLQATMAMLSLKIPSIKSNLQFSLCQKKYKEILTTVREKITNSTTVSLLDDILNYGGPLSKIEYDGRIGAALKNFDQFFK